MRIAISSDNHLDVNRVPVDDCLAAQAQWLQDQQVAAYFYGGDLFNDFALTRHYFTRLQTAVGSRCRVYYIAGNHDLLNHAPFDLVENLTDPAYLHNQYVDLPGIDWRMIGNNGWYDYSFSTYADQPRRVRQWKNAYWLDSSIDQPLSDPARMDRVLAQVDHQLNAAAHSHKRVMLLTHFAPVAAVLGPRPHFTTSRQEYFYQMFRAMTGSARLGQLVEQSGIVKRVFYGHLHGQHPVIHQHGVTYLNQAVGVRNKRNNEWQRENFIDQWEFRLRIIDL